MKIHGIIAMIVAMLFATMASAQSPNNAVWGVDGLNQVFRWNVSRNEFELMPGTLKQVSVGTDGEVWGSIPTTKSSAGPAPNGNCSPPKDHGNRGSNSSR
jgi:hypothetical protein